MKLRWGIAGCGLVAADFCKAVGLLPSEEHSVTAAAASNLERAQQFVERIGFKDAKAFGSYQEMFQYDQVDVVYVANLNHQHRDTVIGAIKAGKNVLVEKPMGINVEQTKEMIQCAKEHNVFLMEGYWSRFFPVYQRIKDEIAQGTIGNPRAIIASFGFALNDANKMNSVGGGTLMATGWYLPAFLSFLFYPEKPERIQAAGRIVPIGVDECGTLTVFYKDGRTASLYWSGTVQLPNEAIIIGESAEPGSQPRSIKIPEYFWCPNKVVLPSGTVEIPLPSGDDGFTYPHSSGFSYEAACVRQCIMQGQKECPKMTLNESLFMAEILEDVRKQIGCSITGNQQ